MADRTLSPMAWVITRLALEMELRRTQKRLDAGRLVAQRAAARGAPAIDLTDIEKDIEDIHIAIREVEALPC